MKRYEVEVTNRHRYLINECGRRFRPDQTRTVVVNGRQLRILDLNAGLEYEVLFEIDPEQSDDDVEEVIIADMTVDELKDELREAGLPVSGRKEDLVERLNEHFTAEPEEEEDEDTDETGRPNESSSEAVLAQENQSKEDQPENYDSEEEFEESEAEDEAEEDEEDEEGDDEEEESEEEEDDSNEDSEESDEDEDDD